MKCNGNAPRINIYKTQANIRRQVRPVLQDDDDDQQQRQPRCVNNEYVCAPNLQNLFRKKGSLAIYKYIKKSIVVKNIIVR